MYTFQIQKFEYSTDEGKRNVSKYSLLKADANEIKKDTNHLHITLKKLIKYFYQKFF